jgi:hypothetical protein
MGEKDKLNKKVAACHQNFNFKRRPQVDVAFALTAPNVSKQDVSNQPPREKKDQETEKTGSIHFCVCYEEGNSLGKDDVNLFTLCTFVIQKID